MDALKVIRSGELQELQRSAHSLRKANKENADLRTKLQQAEEERDRLTMIAEEISKQATIEHYNIEDARKSLSVIQKRHALELAAKEAELVELQQCRDHWKISYEELRQWKESAMTVLSKIDLQAIGKEIGVRIGHDVSTEILPWIKNAKAELERYKWMIEPILAVNAAVTCTYPCVFEKACREAGRRLEGEGSPKVTESVTSGE